MWRCGERLPNSSRRRSATAATDANLKSVSNGGSAGLLRQAWNDDAPYLLVLGTSRSGTSLLTAVLDGHSRVTMSSELFGAEILLGRSTEWSTRSRSERWRGFLDALRTRACEAVGTTWGNKLTTEVVFHGASRVRLPRADAIEDLLARLPRVPTVFILRDGRAVVESKMRRAGDSLEQACRQWVLSVDIWEGMRTAAWPMVTVRFEDLVSAPEPTITALCDAVGLRYEAAMLEAPSSDLLLPEYRRASFDISAVSPMDVVPADGLRTIAEHLARAGYDDAAAAVRPAFT